MNLREKRLSANLTQEQLAKRLGVQRTTVTMWETGETMPRTDKLPEIAKILNCNIGDLFEKSTAEQEKKVAL